MTNVVGIELKQPGKIYYFLPDGLELTLGDKVMVKTSKGIENGVVAEEPNDMPDEELVQPVKKVVRRVNSEDEKTIEENQKKEQDAFKIAYELIDKHKLEMHLVNVDLLFDRSKMTFYFTAESRIDFRELVKDLAGKFKTRIDLRQIGVRDKAKMVGGLGHCGQRLCCTVFLSDLNPVSIKMAKEQNLPLNPQKISGVCGRLMCCLRYEVEAYKDFNKRAPKKGSIVETNEGVSGKVVELNCLRESVTIYNEEDRYKSVALTDLKCGCDASCDKDCATEHKKPEGKKPQPKVETKEKQPDKE